MPRKFLISWIDYSRAFPSPAISCLFGVAVKFVYFNVSSFGLVCTEVIHIFMNPLRLGVCGFMQWFIPMSCRISMTWRTRFRMSKGDPCRGLKNWRYQGPFCSPSMLSVRRSVSNGGFPSSLNPTAHGFTNRVCLSGMCLTCSERRTSSLCWYLHVWCSFGTIQQKIVGFSF